MKKYIFAVILISINVLVGNAQIAIGNKGTDTIGYFESLDELYHRGKIHDTIYMRKADSLAMELLNRGVFFSVNEMAHNMKLFNEIAWSKNVYRRYRETYYLILLNNAYMSNMRGASIYYAEKANAEGRKNGSPRAFIELTVKANIFSLQRRYDEIAEIYEENKDYFDELLLKLKENPNAFYLEGLDALKFMKTAFNAYAGKKDTLNVERVYAIGKELVKHIDESAVISKYNIILAEYSSLSLDFYRESFYAKYQKGLAILNELDQLKKRNTEYSLGFIESSVLEWKSSLFLEMKNIDSASFYLEKYLEIPNFLKSQPILVYNYKARLESLKGNHKEAYEYLEKSLEESFKVHQSLSKEMDDLLYAQTQAEHNQLALERSEEQKRNRTIWIITLLFAGTISVVIIYVLMQAKNRKAKKIIQELNETANVQIAVMEEYGNQVRKEEQKKISQNLHDDLAGTLATLVHRTELAVLKTTDKQQTTELVRIKELITKIFNDVRNNSHNLYEIAHLPGEQMFVEHIQNLADIAFPGSHYKLNIDIEEYALEAATLEFRSELMRVIQEAFTNIVKHAKATRVDLLIYKEENELIVIVKDNGIGVKGKSDKETLGMKSIKERLKKFGGTFVIKENKTGVELIISIPVDGFNTSPK